LKKTHVIDGGLAAPKCPCRPQNRVDLYTVPVGVEIRN
jgi:hypothetical protein